MNQNSLALFFKFLSLRFSFQNSSYTTAVPTPLFATLAYLCNHQMLLNFGCSPKNSSKNSIFTVANIRESPKPCSCSKLALFNPIPHGLFSYLIHMAMAYDKPSLRFHNSKMHIDTKNFFSISYESFTWWSGQHP